MQRVFVVTLDLALLRSNLSAQDGREHTDADVRHWLIDAGFTPTPDGRWRVREADLGQLQPAEVLSAEVEEPGDPERP